MRDRVTANSVRFTETGSGALFAVASPPAAVPAQEFAADAYEQTGAALRDRDLCIVHERIFGSTSVEPVVRAVRQRVLARFGAVGDGAVTFVEGSVGSRQPGLAGIVVHAVPRGEGPHQARLVFECGVPVGRCWRDGDLMHLVLQNMTDLPRHRQDETPADELRRLFGRTQAVLATAGFDYSHVVRTWFYVSELLAWYDAFNRVRSEKYRALGLASGEGPLRLPASTAIGARNSSTASVVLDLVATRGPAGRVHELLSNPEQPEARSYGAAFARGALVPESGGALLQLSGTAAIGKSGESLYPGDAAAQIECTLQKVRALLATRGATLHDIAAAVAFVKRPADVPVFDRVARAFGLDDLPCVVTVGDVCRDELLFELDAELVVKSTSVQA